MSPPREIELKLDVPIQFLPRLTVSSLLKRATTSARKSGTIVSVYFDTGKLKLRRKGLSLRVRRIGRRLVQTVKQENGARAGLFVRNEWEHDIATTRPDLDMASDTPLAPLLNRGLRKRLKPVFETRMRRKTFLITSGDSEVELSIDQGTVKAGRRSSRFCEVELELKQGQVAELFKLAKALAEEVSAQLAVRSKSDRGYALLTAEEPQAVKGAPVALAPDGDVQSAFQAIARACLHQFVANLPVMLAGHPEGVHQMRVALRRLRAANSLFSEMLSDPQAIVLRAELKWIAGKLGPARDLDVFLKRLVNPDTDRKPHEPGMAVLSRALRQRRDDAFARACAVVESPRFRGLILDVAAWIEVGDWTRNPDESACMFREGPIAATAAKQLRRRRKAILKRGKDLGALDPARRHRLRIRAKKLRYAAELLVSAFPRKKSIRRQACLVASLERLQDALGDLNDIAAHEKLLEQFAVGEDRGGKRRGDRAKRVFAAGRLLGREEARIETALKQAKRAYAAFVKAKPFWR